MKLTVAFRNFAKASKSSRKPLEDIRVNFIYNFDLYVTEKHILSPS